MIQINPNGIKELVIALGVILSSLYGILTLIVKWFPTLPEGHWLLKIIKILGKITNRQTDDAKVRKNIAKAGK